MNENPTVGKNQAVLDIHLIQGDTQEVVLAFHDDEGVPIDLASFTLKMDIKASRDLTAPVVETKTVGSGLVKSGHTLTIQFGVSTANWKGEEYYYDISFTNGGAVSRNIRGRIFISKSVTL